jgi:hypothetical protein
MAQLRYIHAAGSTAAEMHAAMTQSPLRALGDCILVWVNEGDFWQIMPTDVAADDRDRKEYERLKRKFAAEG